jgi:hypothetical protein
MKDQNLLPLSMRMLRVSIQCQEIAARQGQIEKPAALHRLESSANAAQLLPHSPGGWTGHEEEMRLSSTRKHKTWLMRMLRSHAPLSHLIDHDVGAAAKVESPGQMVHNLGLVLVLRDMKILQ